MFGKLLKTFRDIHNWSFGGRGRNIIFMKTNKIWKINHPFSYTLFDPLIDWLSDRIIGLFPGVLIVWPVDWSDPWLYTWLCIRLIIWLINLIGWMVDCLDCWLVDWLIVCLVDWLIGWMIYWLIGWLVDYFILWLFD